MANYKVTIWTESPINVQSVYITLFGTDGESKTKWLTILPHPLSKENKTTVTVSCSKDIGDIEMIKLEKSWFNIFNWLPGKVEVESPTGKTFIFPVYHWISNKNLNHFREGKAVLNFNETDENLRTWRRKELREQQGIYCWTVHEKGMPECMTDSLPNDDTSTIVSLISTGIKNRSILYQKFAQMFHFGKTWTSFKDIEDFYKSYVTPSQAFQHWKEDSFFGYQFLNGINPMVIKRITALPENFPVADKVFINDSVNLDTEMENGNIFLCDYQILDGVTTNTIGGNKQYLAAPLVLLHQTEDGMMPIAIQLKQNPGEDNPVFLPSDSENDWLLAKLYVRSADFNLHELNYHLLRTHLLAEVFAVSLKRNLPRVHPVHKILIRHTHNTLQINFLARKILISEDGVFTKFTASGGAGMFTILEKSLSNLTYRSLCIHDDIEDRGLGDVKNFYYKEDGLKLWDIMHSFAETTLGYYYKDDDMVEKDDELQDWIKEIFEHGFLKHEPTGIPQSFTTLTQLVKFVTMVMFTCSVQHAAVNSGQRDIYGWMPNGPSTMREPPPTKKGGVTDAKIMAALPDYAITSSSLEIVRFLSTPFSDAKFLLNFKEEYFTEGVPCKEIEKFKEELQALSNSIKERNKKLELPYTYLDPESVEWSVDV